MKRKLLNRFLVTLIVLLGFTKLGLGQTTVFYDDFNRIGTVGATSTGGTPSMTYTLTDIVGHTNVPVIEGTNTATPPADLYPYLKMVGASATTSVNGQTYITGDLATFSSPFNATLKSNPGLVTWSVNLRENQGALSGLTSGNRIVGVVLSASKADLLANDCVGYMICKISTTTDLAGYRLVKFGAGLGFSGTLSTIVANSTLASTKDYVSIKVTYNPTDDTWTLYERTDGGSSTAISFKDPSVTSTPDYATRGSVVDGAYVNTKMTSFGYFQNRPASTTTFNFYVDNFKVQVDASAANDITSFKFDGLTPAVTGTIDKVNHTVALTVPFGTNVTALVPTIEILGASISPLTGVAQNFTNPVVYAVTSGNSVVQNWAVTVTITPGSSAKDILTFDFNGLSPAVVGTVNSTNHTVALTVPYGTNVTALVPTITVSPNATVSPLTGVAADFTSPVNYTVTAQDASTQVYAVTVTIASSSANDILTFDFNGLTPAVVGTVNAADHTVALTVPFATDLTALVPTITVSAGASISPLTGIATNFASPVNYTVTAGNGTPQVWIVTVTKAAGSSARNILTFNFNGLTPAVVGTVDASAHTVSLTVPYGTNVTALVPTITLSDGATVSPLSGAASNFTAPVVYTVTAQNGTDTQQWTVTVLIAPNTATDILTFNFNGLTPAVNGTVNATTHTVALTVPFGTAVTALVPTITLSDGATVSPLGGVAANFTTPVTYTVTAQDLTTTQPWSVTVTITAETFNNQIGDYRSIATGNWDALTTWETYNGTAWVAATAKPAATNSVYIQSGNVVTLTQNEVCKDLATFKQLTTPSVMAQGTVQIKGFILEVNGRLTSFTTLSPITYGAPTNLGANWPLQSDLGTGTIKVVGDSRALTVTGGWGSGSGTSGATMPNIEIALNAGQTVTLGTNIKFANWTISSGTLDGSTFSVSADIGSAVLKDIIIKSGATYKSSSVGNIIQRSSTGLMGVFTLEQGAFLVLSGATPKIQATTLALNGTVEYNANGDQTLLASASSGAIPSTYSTLILSVAGVKKLSCNTTVNSVYTVSGTATMDLNGFTFTNNAGTDVATLDDIKVNGESIPTFVKTTVTYNIVLDYGTTTVPTVTYTKTAGLANAVLTNAAALPGTSTIVVTAQNGTTIKTYTLNFTVSATQSSDATLKDLKVGGATIAGFASNVYSYTYAVPFGSKTVPLITAVANSKVATVLITQANYPTDNMALVKVTAQNGSFINYVVMYNEDTYIYKIGFVVTGNDLVPFTGWKTGNTIVSTNYPTGIADHGTYTPGPAAFRFIAGKTSGTTVSNPGWLKTSYYPNSGTFSFWINIQATDGTEALKIYKRKKNAADSTLLATLTSVQMATGAWKEFTVDINEKDSTSITLSSVFTTDAATRIWMDDVALKGKSFVGISDLNTDSPAVSLYPNPAKEQLTIDLNAARYQTMEIYNIIGAKLLSQRISESKFIINVGNLNKGIYIIKFTGNGIIYTTKLVKQ